MLRGIRPWRPYREGMSGRHSRPVPVSDAVPLVVAALLIGAGGAAVVLAPSEASLRVVAVLAVLAAVIPLLLLARSDRRVDRTLARREDSLHRTVAALVDAVHEQRSSGASLGVELDRLAGEVLRLRDQLARPPVPAPAPAPAPYPTYLPQFFPLPQQAAAARRGPAPVVVNMPAAAAPVVVERPEPVYLDRPTSTVDLPLLRDALREPEPAAASLRLVDLTAYEQRATRG